MVSILFLIGHGLEQSDIIDHMLDIEKCPSKPQYGMASGQCIVVCTIQLPDSVLLHHTPITLYRDATGAI